MHRCEYNKKNEYENWTENLSFIVHAGMILLQ